MRTDLTLRGTGAGATLDGNQVTRILNADIDGPSALTLENLSVVGGRNSAVYSTGDVTTLDSTFVGNRGNQGGAIQARGMVITSSSTFRGNSASDAGGAIRGYGSATIDSSTFEDNSSQSGGAAVDVNTSGQILNSTFVGNSGSVAVEMREDVVSGSTFLDNDASVSTYQREMFVRGSIFASRSNAAAQLETAEGVTIRDEGGNVFTTSASTEVGVASPDASTPFGRSAADIFATGELADNGGRTETLALNSLGPAIGIVTTGAMPVDQRGEMRTLPADAGAYEYIETEPVPVPIPAADPVTPVLAETGVDATPFLATGAAMFAAAGSLLLLGRRQARRTANGR